eukprot:5083214-Pyramimonas_sp.AAC.2
MKAPEQEPSIKTNVKHREDYPSNGLETNGDVRTNTLRWDWRANRDVGDEQGVVQQYVTRRADDFARAAERALAHRAE